MELNQLFTCILKKIKAHTTPHQTCQERFVHQNTKTHRLGKKDINQRNIQKVKDQLDGAGQPSHRIIKFCTDFEEKWQNEAKEEEAEEEEGR